VGEWVVSDTFNDNAKQPKRGFKCLTCQSEQSIHVGYMGSQLGIDSSQISEGRLI
jgi:hypothetical protein